MKSVNVVFLVVILFIIGTTAWAQDEACSAKSIKGDYGFISTVRRIPPPNSPVKHVTRLRLVGLISYDGGDKATVSGITVTPEGGTAPYTVAGKYAVNSHCTGSVSFQNGGAKTSQWTFVIVAGGTELLTVVQAADDTVPFSQKKR